MFTTDNRFVAELYINPTLEIGKKYGSKSCLRPVHEFGG